jgi:hypothetical protein
MGNWKNDSVGLLRSSRLSLLGPFADEDACTQLRSILAFIPLANATDAIDACG